MVTCPAAAIPSRLRRRGGVLAGRLTCPSSRRRCVPCGTTTIDLALVGHRCMTEQALAALRLDHTLDDHERSRLITRVIETANARAIELLRRQRGGGSLGQDRQLRAGAIRAELSELLPEIPTTGTLL